MIGDDLYTAIQAEVVKVLEASKLSIQAEMAAKGINASGRTSASLRVETYDGGVRLVIGGNGTRTAPLETLEVGRPGGNVPGGFRLMNNGELDVSNTFKAILIRWAEEKGIPDFGWGRATLLGRKIAKEGTQRHRSPVAVYTPAVAEAVGNIRSAVLIDVTDKIHQQFIKDFKNG